MEQFFNKICRFAMHVGDCAGSFNRETWIMISVVTVVTGFMLLRGSGNRL